MCLLVNTVAFAQIAYEPIPLFPVGSNLSTKIIESGGDSYRTICFDNTPTFLTKKEILSTLEEKSQQSDKSNILFFERPEQAGYEPPSGKMVYHMYIKNSVGLWELFSIDRHPLTILSATPTEIIAQKYGIKVSYNKIPIDNSKEYWWKPSNLTF